VTSHLESRAIDRFDDLDRAARAAAVEHASGCADCRARLLAADPTRSFALLAAVPIPAGRLERLSADVGREIDRLGGRSSSRGRAVGSIAASVALAAALVGLVGDRGADTVERAGVERPPARVEPAYGRVDVLSSPGEAQVLDLRVGGTQVVMIFDKDLEL
jgi:hypothetical protein